MFKPKKYINILSEYVKPHCDEGLIHIGDLGKYHQWDYDFTRSQIEGFANLFDYNINDFREMME